MNEEETRLLCTLAAMPKRSWLELDTGSAGERAWWYRLEHEGYIRHRHIREDWGPSQNGALVVQLTEAGIFYMDHPMRGNQHDQG